MIEKLARGLALALFGTIAIAGAAGAAELRLLSVEAMKPALQELAPAFEASSKHKLKVEYATAADIVKKIASTEEEFDVVILDKPATQKLIKAAKIVGGGVKTLVKHNDQIYDVSTSQWSDEPVAARALVDFLGAAKAAEVYKAKGFQPG
jgi:ABC-type molybdate transport system substrate-binding protein